MDETADNGAPTGLQPFLALEMLARGKQLEAEGREILHLEAGEPAIAPAPAVREAIIRHVSSERQPYTEAKGRLSLRKALSTYYSDLHGVAIDPERIVVTTGSSSGFILGFLAGFAPGARIGLARPGYPAYTNILSALGFVPVDIEVTAQNGWRLDVGALAAAHGRAPLDGVMIESPANPTGAILSRQGLRELVAYCGAQNITIISDEVYHGLSFGAECVSALELGDNALVVNSFSKFYAMTGWRVGWLVLPETLVRRAQVLAQSLFISAPTPSQIGAEAALGARDFYLHQVAAYAANGKQMAAGLERLGFADIRAPDGGFYIYADASPLTNNSLQFCADMLEQAGVAATPGVDFDRVNGHRYVRFSFACDAENIEPALARMERYLAAER